MLNTEAFLNSLPVMFYGMAGIFIVTFIIILAVMLVNKLGDKK